MLPAMRLCRGLLAMLIAAVAALALVWPAAAEPPDLAAQLDDAIARKVADMGIPGAIVALSIPGTIDYTRAVGVADTSTNAPITADDHMRIGSVSKTFTGTAILQLADEGRIRLTDPISMYVDGVPSGDDITLDMLGRMRSGLFDYSDDEEFLQKIYGQATQGGESFPTTPAELLGYAFRHPLNFPPGTQWKYTNTNTVLLGLVIEKVTGVPVDRYLQDRYFGPLGLAQTSWPTNGAMPEPFAHGYNKLPSGQVVDATFWNPSWANTAGQIVSDAADMSAWAAVLGRGTLLKPDTQQQRIQGTEAAPGVAYGFAIFNTHGWLGHNGDIPGYATVVVYLPERDATLVVFTNSDVTEEHSAGQIATAVTSIATPDHIYNLSA